MHIAILKHPSAWLPLAMSLTTLAILLVNMTLFGGAPEADEGTTAHLFQLLMGGQVPVVAFFAIKWLPVSPRDALKVLALQVVAALAALAPVYFLHL